MRALWLCLLVVPAPLGAAETLRSGCSPDDTQLANVTASDPLEVHMALAGQGQTSYKVVLSRDGKLTEGYVLGDSLPAVSAFLHAREAMDQRSLEPLGKLAPEEPEAGPKPPSAAKVAMPLPTGIPAVFEDFSARDVKGKNVSLSGLGGRVILVTFWSPQSHASREKLNATTSLYSQFKRQGLSVVAISMDPNAEHVSQALDDVIISWPQVTDRSGLARRYGVDPRAGQTFVLDSSHHVLAAGLSGPELGAKVMELLGAR